jgi:hypothetical protein
MITATRLAGKVLIQGNANLYVGPNSGINLNGGNDGIWLWPNATFNLYANTTHTVYLSGNGVQSLGSGTQFHYWGTTNNTSLGYGGNSAFRGTFYAPNADFALTGSSSNVVDFSGAIISKTCTVYGSYRFHYDENLRRTAAFY